MGKTQKERVKREKKREHTREEGKRKADEREEERESNVTKRRTSGEAARCCALRRGSYRSVVESATKSCTFDQTLVIHAQIFMLYNVGFYSHSVIERLRPIISANERRRRSLGHLLNYSTSPPSSNVRLVCLSTDYTSKIANTTRSSIEL